MNMFGEKMRNYWLPILLAAICAVNVGSCSAGIKSDTNSGAATVENSETPVPGEGGTGKGDIDKSIRKIDFKNFSYEPFCAGDEITKVTVKNGEYSKETKEEDYTDRFYFNIFDVTYGDVDADNKEDAIILSNCNTGGTGQFSEGFVYTLKAGKPALLARFEGGDRAYGGLRGAKVENGLLVVERNDVGEAGGACCPEFSITTKYKWNGKELQTSGAEVRKELYPEEKVSFAKGTSKTTINVTVEDIKRYSLGARAGQTLTVSTNTDNVTVALTEGDANVTEGMNGFSARLKENGKYVIQVQNNAEKPAPVILTIEIK